MGQRGRIMGDVQMANATQATECKLKEGQEILRDQLII